MAIEPEGEVRLYPGNYSVYLEHKKKADKEAKIEQLQSKSPQSKSKSTSTNKSNDKTNKPLSNFERREYEKLETKIAQLETDKEKLETDLATNCSDFNLVQELSAKLATLNDEIDTNTERWLELAEREM